MPESSESAPPSMPLDDAIAQLQAFVTGLEKQRESVEEPVEIPEDIPRFVTRYP